MRNVNSRPSFIQKISIAAVGLEALALSACAPDSFKEVTDSEKAIVWGGAEVTQDGDYVVALRLRGTSAEQFPLDYTGPLASLRELCGLERFGEHPSGKGVQARTSVKYCLRRITRATGS